MNRKKRLRLIQGSLLVLGLLIIFFTYSLKRQDYKESIISEETQKEIKKNFTKNADEGDIFYDISYNGIDLSGNRYVIKSKEARNSKLQTEIVVMNEVNAFFYFKDDTILKIQSDKGIYNNKTLDMKFEDSVKAFYEGSTLLANEAEYSNSKNFLSISDNVVVKDVRGEIFADKLFFDLKEQTLDISSFKENKVNANLNYNEKKF
tara:strand:+ start:127 stop:741 length:615 start_codon:yes stop_codon:yes gene_type:complete